MFLSVPEPRDTRKSLSKAKMLRIHIGSTSQVIHLADGKMWDKRSLFLRGIELAGALDFRIRAGLQDSYR